MNSPLAIGSILAIVTHKRLANFFGLTESLFFEENLAPFMDPFFDFLESVNGLLWGYVNFALIVLFGLYFAWKSRLFQFRAMPSAFRLFLKYHTEKSSSDQGIAPLKAFYASLGGCLGVSNIVGVCTAVQIGGPGALFWAWIAAFLGMILKYSEIYLGMRYRVKNKDGGYDGGPMFYLQKAFRGKWIAVLACLLLSFYGVEIYMFNVVVESVSVNWHVSPLLVIAVLLVLTFVAVSGGIRRVATISAKIIPLFLLLFLAMSFWTMGMNLEKIPAMFRLIVESAFTPQAGMGAFAGSSVMMALSMGISRSCYSSDIGIGYASVIHATSSNPSAQKQASLSFFSIILDTLVVFSLSIMVVLVTDIWKMPIDAALMVQTAFARYFPFVHIFMPIYLFILGYTTIISFYAVGEKCLRFVFPKRGRLIFNGYAAVAFIAFSFVDGRAVFTLLSLAGGGLLMINLIAIFKLRKEIDFTLPAPQQTPQLIQTEQIEPAG
ncbi:MAG: Amino-acid carrier protein AlsT [Chlamydiae bacterium]|nr:Amino-acid carrier protein AlsT [Chlamydiota bacterium]